MRYRPKNKQKLASNFFIPKNNVLDLRHDSPSKHRDASDMGSYFQVDYKEKRRGRWWHDFKGFFFRLRRQRKEKRLADNLVAISRLQLDEDSQQLLFEAQKDRLQFSHSQDLHYLSDAKIKYQMIRERIRHQKKEEAPIAVPTPSPSPVPRRVFQKSPEKPTPILPMEPEREFPQPEAVSFPAANFSNISVWGRLLSFAAWCAVFIIPLFVFGWLYPQFSETKGKVLGASTDGFHDLEAAGVAAFASDFSGAGEKLDSALKNFVSAQGELSRFHLFIQLLPIQGFQGKSALHAIAAGKEFSEAGKYINDAVSVLSTFKPSDALAPAGSSSDLTTSLLLMQSYLRPAVDHLEKATSEMQKIASRHIPEKYRSTFDLLKEKLPAVVLTTNRMVEMTDFFLEGLGHSLPKKYLVVFQNNKEIRPTGGFIGSVAYITIDRGVIREMEVPGGGVYDISGQLHKNFIAPQPLHLVNPDWNFQDANWFPDFPTSAKKLMSFYTESGGPTVDGIIAITPEVIGELLSITGPVYLPDFSMTLDANNFLSFIEEEKEKAKDSKNPKAVLGVLTPLLLDKAIHLDKDKVPVLLESFQKLFSQKSLMFYFSSDELEKEVTSLGLGGEMKSTSRDFLHVSHANISGGKTDQLIDERIDHQANIDPDGKIVDTVTVTRTHRGISGDPDSGTRNLVFTRFYVPQGSTLVDAKGFSKVDEKLFLTPHEDAVIDEDLRRIQGEVLIDEYSRMRVNHEFGKTVFGNWIETKAGTSTQVVIRYELPFHINISSPLSEADHYSLFLMKQPGIDSTAFESNVSLPSSWRIWWYGPQASMTTRVVDQQRIFEYRSGGETDEQFGVVVGKNH